MKTAKYFFPILFLIFLLGCDDLLVESNDTDYSLADFEAAWKRVNSIYPYLEHKKIDWDYLYSVYRPRAELAKGDEFYQVLHDMLGELKDGHVWYRVLGGYRIVPYELPRHKKDRDAFSPFVVRTYFNEELKLSGSGKIAYGIHKDNIGYAFLASFGESYFVDDFPSVFNYLRNTKGIILDVRNDVGGNLHSVDAIVSRFITDPLVRSNYYTNGEITTFPPLQPRNPVYTNPVVVLINGTTFSAGELMTEYMKQIPTVTVVGDTTAGGSGGDRDTYTLPSGIVIEMTKGDGRRYDELPWEWIGIPPDIRVVQTAADIEKGIDKQLEFALDLLK